jgi:hypothetical protein
MSAEGAENRVAANASVVDSTRSRMARPAAVTPS